MKSAFARFIGKHNNKSGSKCKSDKISRENQQPPPVPTRQRSMIATNVTSKQETSSSSTTSPGIPELLPLVNPDRLNSLNMCKTVREDGDASTEHDSIAWTTPEVMFSTKDDKPVNVRVEKHDNPYTGEVDGNYFKDTQSFVGSDYDDDDECNQISFVGEVAEDRTGKLIPMCTRMPVVPSQQWKKPQDPILDSQLGSGTKRRNRIKGNIEELKVAESLNDRPAVYRYTFKIEENKENMKVFTEPDDRRIESIARASCSQIRLEPVAIRTSGSIRLRRVTVESPDLHCLEKCCKLFDDKFPKFYVTGGLGLSSRAISRSYLDEEVTSAANNLY